MTKMELTFQNGRAISTGTAFKLISVSSEPATAEKFRRKTKNLKVTITAVNQVISLAERIGTVTP